MQLSPNEGGAEFPGNGTSQTSIKAQSGHTGTVVTVLASVWLLTP